MSEQPTKKVAVTPEMIAAGVRALKEHYLSLSEVHEYPEIVETVFSAMEEQQRPLGQPDH